MDDDPFRMVEVRCEATVGSERIVASERVLGVVYDDPEARKHIERAVRLKLVDAIVDRWKPKIRVLT